MGNSLTNHLWLKTFCSKTTHSNAWTGIASLPPFSDDHVRCLWEAWPYSCPVSSPPSLEARGWGGALDGLHSSQQEESHPEKCYSIKVERTCLCKERGAGFGIIHLDACRSWPRAVSGRVKLVCFRLQMRPTRAHNSVQASQIKAFPLNPLWHPSQISLNPNMA